jgi:hypothetical protein
VKIDHGVPSEVDNKEYLPKLVVWSVFGRLFERNWKETVVACGIV